MSIFGTGTDAVPISKFIYALRVWEENQYIDFQESATGAELTATIDNGFYLPDDFAVAVASALNLASSGASGASGLYSCTYDRATEKFSFIGQRNLIFDNCETASAWNPGTYGITPTLCSSAYTEGSGSMNMGKSSTGAAGVNYYTSFAPFSFKDNKIGFDFYTADTAYHATGASSIQIHFWAGDSGENGAWTKNISKGSIASGWNYFNLGNFPNNWVTGGSPPFDPTVVTKIYVQINTPLATTVVPLGDWKMDNWHIQDGPFQLRWSTGVHAASGAASALGFTYDEDSIGASAYISASALPNRIIPSQPIRSPDASFEGMNREAIAESGLRSIQHCRTDILFEFLMAYIPENEVKNDWAPFMAKVAGADGPWSRGLDFEWYPKATELSSYIVLHPADCNWKLEEMVSAGLPAFFRWVMSMREVIPQAGTLSLVDIYTRTPG